MKLHNCHHTNAKLAKRLKVPIVGNFGILVEVTYCVLRNLTIFHLFEFQLSLQNFLLIHIYSILIISILISFVVKSHVFNIEDPRFESRALPFFHVFCYLNETFLSLAYLVAYRNYAIDSRP